MNYLINTLKIAVVVIVGILAISTITANAYTYEGDHDPAIFFEYNVVNMEDIGGGRRILYMENKDRTPEYALNIVVLTPDRKVMILAYAYYDNDGELQNYTLTKRGHYKKTIPTEQNSAFLRHELNKLHGITNV